MMKSKELRQKFFDFFTEKSHERVESSSLIPAQDPTLLFTNAGMNQFKDLFLGLEKRSYTRAVSIQKCVRAGGKHNDLSNVGFTRRHLTFFEMMGNFSFGDYFKKEAIAYAWEFLTKTVRLDTNKLHASVFETDDESYSIWLNDIGLPKERIHRLGAKDNFWQMGEIGPCGPCSEIHIDRGPDHGCKNVEKCGPACECDRFLEIWNLVFMQYDRQPDGTDKPLRQKGVDTGMGLERLCSIVQNTDSVYETDIFQPLLKRIGELTNHNYEKVSDEHKAAFRVLADHIRSASMIIADGCAPSNEGRGYVLRKIIRRAALFAQKLTDKNIFPELSRTVVTEFGSIYPALTKQAELIYTLLASEIEKFAANLIRGQAILQTYFDKEKDSKRITGQQAFTLYDTYGFPVELIEVMAQEEGFSVDTTGFEREMGKQKERSRKKVTHELHVDLPETITTEFTGYDEQKTTTEITALIQNNQLVSTVQSGQTCYVITKQSPFYTIGGGQQEDTGWVEKDNKSAPLEHVTTLGNSIAVQITAPTDLAIGDTVILRIDEHVRAATMRNHTATHMLQAALMHHFGPQVKQSGSYVNQDYLRFDFTYHTPITDTDITTIEQLVNEKILENITLSIKRSSYKHAVKEGVIAFFGDKYNPDDVRIVTIPGFSAELCGGTHVAATGDIGCFKIIEASALSAGHKRIVATTGLTALRLFQDNFSTVKSLSNLFKVQKDHVFDAVLNQKEQVKELRTTIKQLTTELWTQQLPCWVKEVSAVNGIPYLFIEYNAIGHDDMKEIAHYLQNKQPGFYVIISTVDSRCIFLASLSPSLASKISLKEFGSWLAKEHGLRGGGSSTLIQGGSPKLPTQLSDTIKKWLSHQKI